MKCPKCGSEMRLNGNHSDNDFICVRCLNKRLKEQKHQQRLDKVLEKFDNTPMRTKVYYYNNCDKEGFIEYINKRFISGYVEKTTKELFRIHHTLINKLSLKTVESIIEDLEKE